MEAVLEVNKKNPKRLRIKRVEIEYKDMNYIIANLEANVIDVNGELWEYHVSDDELNKIMDMIWEYENLDEYDYWPDKTGDHAPLSPMWRLAFYDEFDTYYHKSGATKYPDSFMNLVNTLKKLK